MNDILEFKKVLENEAQAIQEVAGALESPRFADQIKKAIELLIPVLDAGGKIVVTGIGKSGKIGQKIAATLSSTGSPAIYLHATEGLHGDLGMVEKRDCLIAISQSGNTQEILQLLESTTREKIPLIALTGSEESKLAKVADATLFTPVKEEACPLGLAPTTSTTLALVMGDALAVTLMKKRNIQQGDFKKNHPGGSLGKRLQAKVSDFIRTGEELAVVSADTPVDQVIVQSSEKKLGAVLVAEGQKLLGIVTDGDIRRALSNRERFFSMLASEVMTANPVTVRPDEEAIVALKIMENRKSQISVLPVVDENTNLVGLLRLHDLFQKL